MLGDRKDSKQMKRTIKKMQAEWKADDKKKKEEKSNKKQWETELKSKSYYKLHKHLEHIADKQNGIIKLSQIRGLFNKKLSDENILIENNYNKIEYMGTKFAKWVDFETNTVKSPTFISGYDKNHCNRMAVANVLLSGFLDAKDIKQDLGFRSLKQANRLLDPMHLQVNKSNLIYSNLDTNPGHWSNHIPINKLVKVWHVQQNLRTKGINRKYGITNNKPQTVVSVKDYLNFLLYSYKNLHSTKKYINNRFTNWGKIIYSAWVHSPQQKRLNAYLREMAVDRIQSNYINALKQQCNLQGFVASRISEGKTYNHHKAYVMTLIFNDKIQRYNKLLTNPITLFKRRFPINSKSKILQKYHKNADWFSIDSDLAKLMLMNQLLL